MPIEHIELGIDGMSCASCSGRVERKLENLRGVMEVSVNLANARASFSFDTDRLLLPQVINEVASLGYMPVVSELEIGIGGMTCAACSGRVERMLNRQPGVVKAEVNLATEKAYISYVPASIDMQDIMAIIAKLGYEPRPLAEWKDKEDKSRGSQLKSMKADVILAFALSLPVMFLAMGVNWIPGLTEKMEVLAPFGGFWLWVQFFLTTIVIVGPGRRFFKTGVMAYRHLSPDMNSLVMTGTGAAWLYSSFVLIFPEFFPEAARHVFFESAAVVISVVLLGKYLEEQAKGKASRAIKKLMGLQVRTATVLRDGAELELDISQIRVGDQVLCKPGSTIPVDGVVIEGESYIDESMITGESMPVFKHSNDEVIGGTLNQNGLLHIEATHVGRETMLAQIIRYVEQAQSGKLPIQSMADRVILVFTPLVLLIALLTFTIWLMVGPETAITYALIASVAVLVVACPCAMGLATPAAIMVGTGRAAQLGVLFRKGEALERLNLIQHVVFDKTGTLTKGSPQLVSIGGEQSDLGLKLAASVEQGSEHPLGKAIVQYAIEKGLELESITQFRAEPGKGVRAVLAETEVRVGSLDFVLESCSENASLITQANEQAQRGETPVFVARGNEMVAVLGVSDTARADSQAVIRALKDRGLTVSMLTGDHEGPAKSVADHLGIEHVQSGLAPAEKAEALKVLSKQYGKLAFVGDGINDAPALSVADVGIAMGVGTDIAIESADVVLVGDDIGRVLDALRVSRSTVRTIKGNLFWAFIYNILLIPVAAGVLYPAYGILLNPMLAGAAMGFSSVFVVLNSLRLGRIQRWTMANN